MVSIKIKIKKFILKKIDFYIQKFYREKERIIKSKLGHCAIDAIMKYPVTYSSDLALRSIFLHEGTWIHEQSKFIMEGGKFIMMKNSGAAQGLTVITHNHPSVVGMFFKEVVQKQMDVEKDVVVEEDVWIGANVTLLAGVKIGRGAIIGAGSVCRSKIPPYAIALGNPAQVVGFRFRPDGIIEHEKLLYVESERHSENFIEKNYKKYFEDRI